MNPFENEKKEIDEYSLAEIEKLYGFDPRAYDNDFKEVEPMDDDEYMLFIAGVEPEDIEDKDDDPDNEPIQDPAVCDDGRCGPKYDDDFDVPEWPEWQEEDEIEEISDGEKVEESVDPFADDYDAPDFKNTYDAEKTKQSIAKDQELLGGKANLDDPFAESLTEDVINEANPFKAIGNAVKKGFNKATGKTADLFGVFENFYLVASGINGGNLRFLDKNGNKSDKAVYFDKIEEAKTTAKNTSAAAKCKVVVRGITKETLNGVDADGFSTKGTTTTAPLYVYVSGKETLDNTARLIATYNKLKKQVGTNTDDEPPVEGTESESRVSEADLADARQKCDAFVEEVNKLPAGEDLAADKLTEEKVTQIEGVLRTFMGFSDTAKQLFINDEKFKDSLEKLKALVTARKAYRTSHPAPAAPAGAPAATPTTAGTETPPAADAGTATDTTENKPKRNMTTQNIGLILSRAFKDTYPNMSKEDKSKIVSAILKAVGNGGTR